MIYADYLVIVSVLILSLFNRDSVIFLIAFALCEAVFLMPVNDFGHSIFTSLMFSLFILRSKAKLPLKIAMLFYSVMFWLSAISYQSTEVNYFDVIFPYAIKLIDIFVIIYLIANREKGGAGSYKHGFTNNSHWC